MCICVYNPVVDKPVRVARSGGHITTSQIGERSSHTWFVLKYLIGYPDVRNDDGSWTEWGNLVRTPIEKS